MMKAHLLFIASKLCSCCDAGEEFPVLFKSSRCMIEQYGICTHINRIGHEWEFDSKEKDLEMIKNVGAYFVRTDFDWGYNQPELDKPISFSHHDRMLNAVEGRGLKMLGILSSPRNDTFAKWEFYVAKTVSHYKNEVRYWEVINEADLWHRRQPEYTPSDYVTELRTASSAIRRQNGKIKILFSGISNITVGFVEKVFEEDVADCFDIMNVHWYANKNNEPELFFDYFQRLHTIMKQYGIKKPVWLTETGCTTAEGYADEETQAKRLPRVYLISFACGIEKVFWYKSRAAERSENFEEHFGIWHKDYTPKPAYYAYKTLVQMCPSGSSRPQITRIGSVYVAKWKKKRNECVTAVWTSKKDTKISIERFQGDMYDISGNRKDIHGDILNVSPEILYFTGKNYLTIIDSAE